MAGIRHQFPKEADWLIDGVTILQGKVLGSGAYGIVRLAVWKGCLVAAKQLHSSFFQEKVVPTTKSQVMAFNFAEECKLLSQLRHPHMVQLYGVCFSEDDGAPIMIIELLHETLRERLQRFPRLTLRDHVDLALQLSKALIFLHKRPRPIAHCDLSSTNVLLTKSGDCKIVDLGVAKTFEEAAKIANTKTPGHESYMPVEALDAEACYDVKIDVFSLGVLILEMCVRHDPMPSSPWMTKCDGRDLNARRIVPDLQRRATELCELGKNPLRAIIESCLQQQEARPAISTVHEQLEKITVSPDYETCVGTRGESGELAQVRCELQELRQKYDASEKRGFQQLTDLADQMSRLSTKVADTLVSTQEITANQAQLAKNWQQHRDDVQTRFEAASDEVRQLSQDVQRVRREQETSQAVLTKNAESVREDLTIEIKKGQEATSNTMKDELRHAQASINQHV